MEQRNPEYSSSHFSDINHLIAIRYYNEGMQIKDKEISFQYFYKVLEYFLITACRERFNIIISDY